MTSVTSFNILNIIGLEYSGKHIRKFPLWIFDQAAHRANHLCASTHVCMFSFFTDVSNWGKQLADKADADICRCLVANKCDIPDDKKACGVDVSCSLPLFHSVCESE